MCLRDSSVGPAMLANSAGDVAFFNTYVSNDANFWSSPLQEAPLEQAGLV